MIKNYKISIITVVYNDFKGIELTLNSILNQSLNPYELIIKDGNSTDDTIKVIDSFKSKMKYLKIYTGKDLGIFDAMNYAIQKLSGDIVVFLNAGDIFHSEDVLKYISEVYNGESMIYGNMVLKDVENSIPFPGRELNKKDLYFLSINHQSTFFNVNILKNKYQGYNLDYKYVSDQFLIRQFFNDFTDIKYINKIVAKYDNTGFSSKFSFRLKFETYKLCLNFYGTISMIKLIFRDFLGKYFKYLRHPLRSLNLN